MSRFPTTYCSECGTDLGPGDAGVSSCCDHGACRVVARGDVCECDRRSTHRFTEEELLQADLAYLASQERRIARRVSEAHELDLQELRRAGL